MRTAFLLSCLYLSALNVDQLTIDSLKMMTSKKVKGFHLGKSSSCHSSFTSMFSIRRVASVVPIPQRGEQGPGGGKRKVYQWTPFTIIEEKLSHNKSVLTRQSASSLHCRILCLTQMTKGKVGIVGGFYPNNFSLEFRACYHFLSHGFYPPPPPFPEEHMWEACDWLGQSPYSDPNIMYEFLPRWNSRGQWGGWHADLILPHHPLIMQHWWLLPVWSLLTLILCVTSSINRKTSLQLEYSFVCAQEFKDFSRTDECLYHSDYSLTT